MDTDAQDVADLKALEDRFMTAFRDNAGGSSEGRERRNCTTKQPSLLEWPMILLERVATSAKDTEDTKTGLNTGSKVVRFGLSEGKDPENWRAQSSSLTKGFSEDGRT